MSFIRNFLIQVKDQKVLSDSMKYGITKPELVAFSEYSKGEGKASHLLLLNTYFAYSWDDIIRRGSSTLNLMNTPSEYITDFLNTCYRYKTEFDIVDEVYL